MKKILGIIPARGGSKSIPNKNITNVLGKPLISYTIESALKAQEDGFIDELIVSTDSIMIQNEVKRIADIVPFTRPSEISRDDSLSIEYVIHAIDYYRSIGVKFTDVIVLQPTSPLRNSQDISNAIKIYLKKNVKSLISCYLDNSINLNKLYHVEDEIGFGVSNDHYKGVRRQETKPLYVRNGAIFITKVSYLIKNHYLVSKNPLVYVMPKSRSIDIDHKQDLIDVIKYFELNDFL